MRRTRDKERENHPNASEKDSFVVVVNNVKSLEEMFSGIPSDEQEKELNAKESTSAKPKTRGAGKSEDDVKKSDREDRLTLRELVREIAHSMRFLCWVYCLPPRPQSITNKLAFAPPEEASYKFVTREFLVHHFQIEELEQYRPLLEVLFELQSKYATDQYHFGVETLPKLKQGVTLMDKDETTSFSFPPRQHATEFSDEEAESASRGKQNMFLPPTPPPSRMSNKPGSTGKIGWEHQEVEGFYALRSQSGNRIACVHIRQSAQAPFTFLYSHGNSCDFGHVLHFLSVLCTVTKCNLVAYDYSGYGGSRGRPSEEAMYQDHMAVFTLVLSRYKLTPKQVVLVGHSIGTVPAVELASKVEVAGVILEAPIISGLKTIRCCRLHDSSCVRKRINPFPSDLRAPEVTSPVLVIHGTHDEIISLEDGAELAKKFQNGVEPLFINGAGHNNLGWYVIYYARILVFLYMELLGKTPHETMVIMSAGPHQQSRDRTLAESMNILRMRSTDTIDVWRTAAGREACNEDGDGPSRLSGLVASHDSF